MVTGAPDGPKNDRKIYSAHVESLTENGVAYETISRYRRVVITV